MAVSRAIVQMGGVTSLPALLQHHNPKVRAGVVLLIETLEDSGVTDGISLSTPTASGEAKDASDASATLTSAAKPTPSSAADPPPAPTSTPFSIAAAADGAGGAFASVALTPAAVRSILSCLRDTSPHTQQAAAGMLALCASLSDANKAVMLLERCVEPLVELLRSPAEESRVKAAAALLSLTRLSRPPPSAVSRQPQTLPTAADRLALRCRAHIHRRVTRSTACASHSARPRARLRMR